MKLIKCDVCIFTFNESSYEIHVESTKKLLERTEKTICDTCEKKILLPVL